MRNHGVPTATNSNQSSVTYNARDVDTYMATEVKEGAMLGLFHAPPPPFTPWCQVNVLLTHPQKDSHHPLAIIINSLTPNCTTISFRRCTCCQFQTSWTTSEGQAVGAIFTLVTSLGHICSYLLTPLTGPQCVSRWGTSFSVT